MKCSDCQLWNTEDCTTNPDGVDLNNAQNFACFVQKVDSETKGNPQAEAELHMDQAYSYKEAGKFEDVLHECNAAIEIDPYLAEAYNLMGVAFEELGYEEEARESYMQAIELDPEDDDFKYNLSCLEGKLGDERQLVTIATFNSPTEARIPKMILDSEGIWSFIADSSLSSVYPLVSVGLEGIATVRLQVRQPDAKRAFQLLNEKPDGVKLIDEEMVKPVGEKTAKHDLKLLPILLGAIICIVFHFTIVGHFTPRVTVNLAVSILMISTFYLVGGFITGVTAKYRGALHGLLAAGAASLFTLIILIATGYTSGYIKAGVIATIVGMLMLVAFESGVGALGGTLGVLFINKKYRDRHYLRTLIIRIVIIGIFSVICLALVIAQC